MGDSERSNKQNTASTAFCCPEDLKFGLSILIRVELALSKPLEG
tara:strand:+ start:5564 stop:5695 length:132 start_codon:yes stop_codon:yes gene_type:complete